MGSHCDLDIDEGNLNLKNVYTIPTHDDALPYQVWWQKVQWFWRYYPDTDKDQTHRYMGMVLGGVGLTFFFKKKKVTVYGQSLLATSTIT